LTFEAFFDCFPTFPVMLDAQSFYATAPSNDWARLPTLMSDFPNTFLYKRYAAVRSLYSILSEPGRAPFSTPVPPEQRNLPLGMIFPWDGLKGGMIMHDMAAPTHSAPYFSIPVSDNGKLTTYRIEPFRFWLRSMVASGWTPSSPYSPPRSVRWIDDLGRRGSIVRPWAVHACGASAACVLSWLWLVASVSANSRERSFFRRENGKAGVAISNGDLARETGLTAPQCRGALTVLVDRGFITKTTITNSAGRVSFVQLRRYKIKAAEQAFDQAGK
jgi:hypothetical protein